MTRHGISCAWRVRVAIVLCALALGGCITPEESDVAGTWRGDDSSTLVFAPGGRWEIRGFDWSKVVDEEDISQMQLQSDCVGEWCIVPAVWGGGKAVEVTVRTQRIYTVFFHIEVSGRGFWGCRRPCDLRLHIRSGDPDDGQYCLFRRIEPSAKTP